MLHLIPFLAFYLLRIAREKVKCDIHTYKKRFNGGGMSAGKAAYSNPEPLA
jgi:hypothetical protein